MFSYFNRVTRGELENLFLATQFLRNIRQRICAENVTVNGLYFRWKFYFSRNQLEFLLFLIDEVEFDIESWF